MLGVVVVGRGSEGAWCGGGERQYERTMSHWVEKEQAGKSFQRKQAKKESK